MNKLIFLLILYFINVFTIVAQTSKYPITKNGEWWSVVLNKNKVQGYSDSILSKPNKLLNFKEIYYVYAETDKSLGIGENELEYYIDKNNALLTNNCLVTDNQVSVKATVVSHLDKKDKATIDYFDSPINGTKRSQLTLYKIYYVYDIYPKNIPISNIENIQDDNVYVLVGTNETYEEVKDDERDPNHIILGWVKANKILFWNTRIAVEPNLTENSKSNKTSTDKYGKIWKTEVLAKKDAIDIPNLPINKMVFSDKEYVNNGYTYFANDYRYPVLKKTSNNTYKIAFVGGIQSNTHYTLPKTKSKKIELLFLLDATKTMRPLGKVLPNSINNAATFIKNKYSSFDITWGFSVYRNKKDIACADFDHYKYYGRTKEINKFKSWVNTLIGKFGSCSSLLQEDLFHGACKSMDDFFSTDEEAFRIIYIITDIEGLERDHYEKRYLANKLDYHKAHFILLNVNESHSNSLKTQINNIVKIRNNNSLPFEKMNSETGYYEAFSQNNLSENFYTGMLIQTMNNQNEDINKIYERIISESIKSCVRQIDKEIHIVDTGDLIPDISGWKFPFIFNPEFEDIKFQTDIGVYFYKGYICNSYKKLNHEPFTPVAFFKEKDIENLYRLLDGLSRQITSMETGKVQEHAFEKLVKELANTKEVYLNTVTERENFAGEIPVLTGFLKDYLENGTITEPKQLRTLKKEIKNKRDYLYEEWTKLISNPEEEAFYVGLDRFRWIPLDYLP